MFKSILASFIIIILNGCVSTPESTDKLTEQFGQVNDNISIAESRLIAAIEQHCSIIPEQIKNHVSNEVAMQIKKNPPVNELQVSPIIEQPLVECSPELTSKESSTNMFENMIVMGEVEKIYLLKEEVTFDARIDSGAVSSSLGVFNLTKFERDGDNWVRFSLEKDKESTTYEYPVLRMIKIVQQLGRSPDNRPVIELQFTLGEKNYVSKFNLANRSHLDFQVLIGREFLRDIAIVDVSQKYILGGK